MSYNPNEDDESRRDFSKKDDFNEDFSDKSSEYRNERPRFKERNFEGRNSEPRREKRFSDDRRESFGKSEGFSKNNHNSRPYNDNDRESLGYTQKPFRQRNDRYNDRDRGQDRFEKRRDENFSNDRPYRQERSYNSNNSFRRYDSERNYDSPRNFNDERPYNSGKPSFSRDRQDGRNFSQDRSFYREGRDSRDSHDGRERQAFKPQRSYDDGRTSSDSFQKHREFDNDNFSQRPRQRSFDRPSYQDNFKNKQDDFFSPSSYDQEKTPKFDRFEREDHNNRSYPRERGENDFRQNREDRGFRNNRDNRNGYRENSRDYPRNDRPRTGRTSRRMESMDSLFDVDKSILRLLSKRAELLQIVKRDKRVAPQLEKQLRSSWEKNVANVTANSKIAREFFNLLQQIEPIMLVDGKPSFYNMAPQFKPVNINLKASPPNREMCILFALAASSGAMASFDVQLSSQMMSAIKAFNQLGGQLWWEGHEKVLSRGGEGIARHVDKVIPVGEDALSFYLLLSMALQVPSRLKIVGDGPLRTLDTKALRNFLPYLNARMTTVIPSHEGIPVRLESAGMLPDELTFSGDLPKDFIFVFILVSAVSQEDKTLKFIVENHPELSALQEELVCVSRFLGLETSAHAQGQDLIVEIEAKKIDFESLAAPSVDTLFASTLLAIPAFAGGRCELQGRYLEKDKHCLEFLKSAGLQLEVTTNAENLPCVITKHPEVKLSVPDYSLAPNYPLALVFASLAALSGEEVKLPDVAAMPHCQEKEQDIEIIEGFLSQVGLYANEEKILLRKEVENAPWFLPDEEWGLALALAAFMRPNIRITNPEIVNAFYPLFWRIYNTLPEPKTTPIQKEVKEEENTRRRIIASFDDEEDAFEIEHAESEDPLRINEEYAIDDTEIVEENNEGLIHFAGDTHNLNSEDDLFVPNNLYLDEEEKDK